MNDSLFANNSSKEKILEDLRRFNPAIKKMALLKNILIVCGVLLVPLLFISFVGMSRSGKSVSNLASKSIFVVLLMIFGIANYYGVYYKVRKLIKAFSDDISLNNIATKDIVITNISEMPINAYFRKKYPVGTCHNYYIITTLEKEQYIVANVNSSATVMSGLNINAHICFYPNSMIVIEGHVV